MYVIVCAAGYACISACVGLLLFGPHGGVERAHSAGAAAAGEGICRVPAGQQQHADHPALPGAGEQHCWQLLVC